MQASHIIAQQGSLLLILGSMNAILALLCSLGMVLYKLCAQRVHSEQYAPNVEEASTLLAPCFTIRPW